jgi:hypothetical protein
MPFASLVDLLSRLGELGAADDPGELVRHLHKPVILVLESISTRLFLFLSHQQALSLPDGDICAGVGISKLLGSTSPNVFVLCGAPTDVMRYVGVIALHWLK